MMLLYPYKNEVTIFISMHLTLLVSNCIILHINVFLRKQMQRFGEHFMEFYTVCFFGHRYISDIRIIDKRLTPIIKELIRTKSYVSFNIGRMGDFDEYAASVIKSVQKLQGKENSELTLVLPYPITRIDDYKKYYDNIIIPENICNTHPKRAIELKNRWMIEQADLIIVYVKENKGGAYSAMKYAERKKRK